MFSLKLFGGVLLEGPSGPVAGRVTQRRRLAVLALLGASEAPLSRPKILGLLWPDHPESRGRHLLSDTLYVIRNALGDDTVLTSGNDVQLNPDRIEVDVRNFRRALAEDRDGDAVEIYRGAFLDGFYISSAPEFEMWTDRYRRRCSELQAGALERLADGAEEDGRSLEALEWWKRRAAHEPLNSRVAVQAMRAYAKAGDTAGALAHARIHRQLLESEFGAAPPKELVLLEERLKAPPSGEAAASGDEATKETVREPAATSVGRAAVRQRYRGLEPVEALKNDPPYDRTRYLPAAAIALLGALLLGGAITLAPRSDGFSDEGRDLDPHLVMAAPYRVAGAAPSLAFLSEGMVDLLEAKLTGEGGLRAVDARAVLHRWERARRADVGSGDERGTRVARGLGAGRLLTGSVIGNEERLVLTAAVRDVASDRIVSRASVDGTLAQLTDMVDRLVAQILVQEAGESERRLADLTSHSLPALRHFLEGQAAHRRGHHDVALDRFTRAVQLDSTFALAGLMSWRTWTFARGARPGGLNLAWRHRDRLPEQDREYLVAILGPHHPRPSTGAELLAAREELVRRQPNSPEAWFALGDWLAHFGSLQGLPDSTALGRAADAFDRALGLDSAYLPALQHHFEIAVIRGDAAQALQHGGRFLEGESGGLDAAVISNLTAYLSRGRTALPEIVARADTADGAVLRSTLMLAHVGPQGSALRDTLADHLWNGARREPELLRATGRILYLIAHDRGRPHEAARIDAALLRAGGLDSVRHIATSLRDALWWSGDREAADRAASLLRDMVESEAVSADADSAAEALCALGQWRLARGDRSVASSIIERWERELGDDAGAAAGCLELLRGWRSIEVSDSAEADDSVARFRTLLSGGHLDGRLLQEGFLILARVLEARGESAEALRALSRQPLYFPTPRYRSTFLRERGRLATAVGDTSVAVDAYSCYLAMRTQPEPSVESEVSHVREELAKLVDSASALEKPS